MAQKWTTLSWVLDRSWWFTSVVGAPCRIQEGTYEATAIAIGNNVSLDNLNRMVLDVTCEINMTWLEGGPAPFRALIGQKSRRWLDHHEMARWWTRTTEYTWLEVNNMQALLWEVEQGFETNKESLMINNLREAVSFTAWMWLVVATRLQAQHLSFRLHTSSNTPFVPTNDAQESFRRFQEGNALSLLQLLS
jgi:hypothetical protein